MPKIFERIICKQISHYMENKPYNYITGFKKFHGTQWKCLCIEIFWHNKSWFAVSKIKKHLTETFLSNNADDSNLYYIVKDLDLSKGMLHKDL